MDYEIHHINDNDSEIAEIISDNTLIHTASDGLDLLGTLYFQGFDKIILHEHNICPEFFDLKTGIAGEILQKFSNYRMRLAVVGDFSSYTGKSLSDFMFESNKLGDVNFVKTTDEAIRKLSL